MADTVYDEVFSAALGLPPRLRVMLAEQLLKSLDATQQAEIDLAWSEEAEKRVLAVERGEVTPIPGEQIIRELRLRN